jgi:plasmid stabilization system protein ParE
MTRLEFHPDALAEYEASVEHYESIQPGLGSRFIASVESALQSILESPATWPVLEQDVRRRLTRVFPYAVLYSVEPEYILVIAILHCHRNPGYWQSRVAGT